MNINVTFNFLIFYDLKNQKLMVFTVWATAPYLPPVLSPMVIGPITF